MALLHQLLSTAVQKSPGQTAVIDPGVKSVTYKELEEMAGKVSEALYAAGVRPGDRVGLLAEKSVESLAVIFGILRCGAAYVPVDVNAPLDRGAFILEDAQVKAVYVADNLKTALLEVLPDSFYSDTSGQNKLAILVNEMDNLPSIDGLAYILYTSGSTGMPKGVMVSHANALAFLNWASEEFRPKKDDVFSSHAPFHFDLSILDIYLSIKHRASLVLINAKAGKQPLLLSKLIEEYEISIWYSTPTILKLLLQFGKLADWDHKSLRLVLFAGEIFPMKHLRSLQQEWPAPVYYNLYGPTETNVCTFYKVPVPVQGNSACPIGKVCSEDVLKVVNSKGKEVSAGEEGELLISGPSVMLGYWNKPTKNDEVLVSDEQGIIWYRTGDIVKPEADGNLIFLGRQDRMVKRRGYRIELGEIESTLMRHPDIDEIAVVTTAEHDEVKLIAFFTWAGAGKPSIIKLKQYCALHLPNYMIPDKLICEGSLPKTSTNKTDYQKLMTVV